MNDPSDFQKLKKELKNRKLKTSEAKKLLQGHLRAVLAFEIEHGEDGSESECDEDEDEDEHDQKDVERCTSHMQVLAFKDVEESLNTSVARIEKMFVTGYRSLKIWRAFTNGALCRR